MSTVKITAATLVFTGAANPRKGEEIVVNMTMTDIAGLIEIQIDPEVGGFKPHSFFKGVLNVKEVQADGSINVSSNPGYGVKNPFVMTKGVVTPAGANILKAWFPDGFKP